jgi:hypothetical protein
MAQQTQGIAVKRGIEKNCIASVRFYIDKIVSDSSIVGNIPAGIATFFPYSLIARNESAPAG